MRKYSSISVETTLASSIGATGTTITVATGTGSGLLGGVTLAAGNVDQFTLAIDPDTTNEEIVFATANSGDSFTIIRGRAGSSAITHGSGATVRHVLTSDDLTYFNATLPATLIDAKGDLIAGSGANAADNLAVGSNGTVLTADSAETLGIKWASAYPNQTGNSGKYLTTNGSAVSWGTVDALPSQTGNSGKFLTTNGTAASWDTVSQVPSQTGNSGKYLTTDGTSASWNDPNLVTTNAQTGTTYTLVLSDRDKLVTLSNASAITLTVPLNSSVAYPTGSIVNIQQIGAGQVTVSGAAGVTINGTGTVTRTQWSAASLLKTATNTWTLIGDLA